MNTWTLLFSVKIVFLSLQFFVPAAKTSFERHTETDKHLFRMHFLSWDVSTCW